MEGVVTKSSVHGVCELCHYSTSVTRHDPLLYGLTWLCARCSNRLSLVISPKGEVRK